jgi:hypothetical protein
MSIYISNLVEEYASLYVSYLQMQPTKQQSMEFMKKQLQSITEECTIHKVPSRSYLKYYNYCVNQEKKAQSLEHRV